MEKYKIAISKRELTLISIALEAYAARCTRWIEEETCNLIKDDLQRKIKEIMSLIENINKMPF